MAGYSSDFGRFIEANYPDDFSKISVSDVKEDVVNTIVMRYESKYDIWKRIPEWIKSYYGDRLPAEVFTWHEPYDKFQLDFERRMMGDFGNDCYKLDAFIYRSVLQDERACRKCSEALNKGYSTKASFELGYAKKESDDLFKAEGGKVVSKEGRKKLRKIRQKVAKIIKDDWRENQPNRYALRMAREYDIYTRKSKKAKNPIDKIKYKIKAAKSSYYFNQYLKKIDDAETSTKLDELMKVLKKNHNRLETKQIVNNVSKMVNKKVSDAAIKHFNNKVMDGLP